MDWRTKISLVFARLNENKIMTERLEKAYSEIINVFVTTYKLGIGCRLISRLSKSFQDYLNSNTQHVKSKWEREGVMVISEDEQGNICKLQWKTTPSHNLRE